MLLPGLLCEAAGQEVPDAQLDGTEPIPLKLKFIPFPQGVHYYHIVQRKIFDAYLASHPNVRPYRYSEFLVEGPQAQAGDLMAIAAGTAPDIFGYGVSRRTFGIEMLANFIEQDFLQPLDEYFDAASVNARVSAQLAERLKGDDGKTYGVADRTRIRGYVLYYRKDLFRRAQLTDEDGEVTPPTTWEELYAYAQRLTDPDAPGKPAYGLAIRPGGAGRSSAPPLIFLYQGGGDVVRQRADGKWECAFHEEKALDGLAFFRKLAVAPWQRGGKTYHGVAKIYRDPGPRGMRDMWQDFARGKVADVAMMMALDEEWVVEQLVHVGGLDPYTLGVAPLPDGPGGNATVATANIMAVNRIGASRETIEAACEFVRYMSSVDAERIFVEACLEEGEAKSIPPYLLKEFGHEEELKRFPQGWAEARESVLKHGRFAPRCPGYSKISTHTLAKIADLLIDDARCATREGLRELITAEAMDINNALFQTRPEAQMNSYRRVAWFTLISLLTLSVLAWLYTLMRKVRHRRNHPPEFVERMKPRVHLFIWLFVLPAFITILMWRYLPLALGSVMAFQDYNLVKENHFVGLDNFIEAFCSPLFWKVLKNTAVYVGMTLFFGFCAPILLALAFAEIKRLTLFFRLVYYLPAVTSPLVVMFLWKLLFRPDPQGFLNQALAHLSKLPFIDIPAQGWLADPNTAMACIVLVGIWSGAGPASLIYLAALKAVPADFYEAASLDGCGFWRKLLYVTAPTLKPLLVINFLGTFVGAFQAMQNIFVMTGGGPADATRTLGIEIWFNAFMYLKFGYATAMAWILGSALIGFAVMQMRMIRKVEFTRAQEN
ncbi:MAG: extracellular solute-binding protein [Nitrospiraceae bacterium]|nr:extracellular solute-binding protein [Nitrospiraceae bacterium]